MTTAEAFDLLDEVAEMESIQRAEAGMGAMSLGYGTDGAYAAAAAVETPDFPELREARRIARDYALVSVVHWHPLNDADSIPF